MTNKTFYLNSAFEAKSYRKGSKSLKIAGYANTITKDRAGDVVTAEAWAKGVENFRKNPVMLYQHKHDTPIGRIEKIVVDTKGIYVEGAVSEAAEKIHGIQTLIKDGALKSFSVGFRVKDGKYNRNDDSMTITEVELLEISVVSVPCNQDSLFSVRKSFESDEDYSKFVKEFKEIDQDDQKAMRRIKAGITDMTNGHYHTVEVDETGNGVTTYASHMTNHAHKIINGILLEAEGHTHSITMVGVPIHDMESGETVSERPLSPTEEEAMNISKETTVEETKSVDQPEEAIEIVMDSSVELDEKTVLNTVASDEIETKAVSDAELSDEEEEETLEVRDPNEAIPFVNLLAKNTAELQTGDLVNYEEKMYKVLKIATAQSPIFKFLEIDAEGKDCDNVLNVNAEEISQITKTTNLNKKDTSEDAIVNKELHEDSTKENDTMAEQVVETIDLTEATKSVQVENTKAVNTVSEPRVANLVEKTGEAIIKNADAQDLRGGASHNEQAELRELQFEISKYKDEIKALQSSKMLYQENQSRAAQFSEKEMANAVLLSKMLNKRDVFDTKFGSRMKAITTVDQFLSNFSANIYTEMEQQLVIAPMFNRLAVDAKNFRVPVADEDTDGDVAMFKSGTYSTGIGDITNVPTSNQNTISSVDFTPHKFMATTHLAKDEEEDTVLPLLDFLRAAATRRLARAIDKSILRGTGALTGFTASPTNAIISRCW
jgi:HK97 family phage prohead protease